MGSGVVEGREGSAGKAAAKREGREKERRKSLFEKQRECQVRRP